MAKNRSFIRALRYVALYAILSLIWIYTSDEFLKNLNIPIEDLTIIATVKGFIFVFITSVILLFIIKKAFTSEDNYNLLFRTNPQPMWIYDLKTLKFLEVNDAAVSSYGYSRNEFLKMDLKDIRPEEDIKLLLEDVEKTIPEINSAGIWRHKKKNGEVKIVEVYSHLVVFKNRQARLVLAIDITERNLAEGMVKKSEEKYRLLFQNNIIGVYISNIEGKIIDCNKAFADMFGYSSVNEVLNTSAINFHSNIDSRTQFIEKLKVEGKLTNFNSMTTKKDGSKIWTLENVMLIDNEIIQGTIIDITDRQKAESEILRLNRVYALLSNTNQAIVRIHEQQELFNEICRIAIDEGKFRMAWIGLVNESENRVEVVASAGEAGNYLEEINIDLSNELKDMGPIAKVIKNGEYYILNDIENEKNVLPWKESAIKLGYKSSAAFPLKLSGKAIGSFAIYTEQTDFFQQQEISLLLEMALDISFALEYIKTEEKRKKAEERIRILIRSVEQSPASIIITNHEANIEYVNEKFTEQTGYSAEEVIGKNPRILNSGETSPEKYSELWSTVLSGRNWGGEFHNRKKNGELFWQFASISPILDDDGKITHFVAVQEDITARKKMIDELVEAKKKAEEMNKLKSSFLANMSHELRTPMIAILGYSEILKEQAEKNDIKEMSETILSSGKRLMRTLNQILDISIIEANMRKIQKTCTNLSEVLAKSVQLYKPVAEKANLTLKINIKNETIKADVDTDLLNEIADNLLSNAIKYTKIGGIVVEVDTEQIDSNNYAVIKVIDSGIGISNENQKLIFEEFRQASEGISRTYEGIGLGLSITKKIVELMGGEIIVQSEMGKGSTFTVRFPLVI